MRHPCVFVCALLLSACPERSHQATPQHTEPNASEQSQGASSASAVGASAEPSSATTSTGASSAGDGVSAPPERLALAPDSGPALPPLPALKEMKFRIVGDSLWVDSPLGGASLGLRASVFEGAAVTGEQLTLKYQDPFSCVPKAPKVFTANELQARIENGRAFALYQQNAFVEAARGFRRASELDSGYALARTNHIAALCRAGDLPSARLAFRLALEKDAVRTYEKLVSDADFAPLRSEFRRGTTTGAAPQLQLVGKDLRSFEVAYSAARKLIAVVRGEASWGSENWMTEVHIFDVASGQLVSLHSLVDWRDTQEDGAIAPLKRKAVEARLAVMQETLAALGFQTQPHWKRAAFEYVDNDRPVTQAKLQTMNASLVADGNDTLRLVRGNAVLATFATTLKAARPESAFALPEAEAIVYFGHYEVAEGCDSGPGTRVEILRAPAFK